MLGTGRLKDKEGYEPIVGLPGIGEGRGSGKRRQEDQHLSLKLHDIQARLPHLTL